ncbi:MAG: hypothetical protein FWC26_14325 [Fibromonadales bacterium]|nr:hypothetical protein [Fibromonadales bacterium]
MRVESYIFALLVSANAFAQTFSLEAGGNYFFGDLRREIHLSPYGGVGFEYGLSEWHSGYIQGSYSYLFLKKNEDFHGLHQFVGRAGVGFFEYFGVGVSLAGVRGRDKTSQAKNYMLASSESEFGWDFRFKIWYLVLYYDIIWTAPKNSHLLQLGASFSTPNL